MELKQAKEYFDLGIITGFAAVRVPMSQGWALQIDGKEGREWTLETQQKKPREFSSLDTLTRQVELICGKDVWSLKFGIM